MNKNYDIAVFIGRFQLFTEAHKHVIECGLEQANSVLVIIGSSFAPRNLRNPLREIERSAIITTSFPKMPISTAYVEDYAYNDEKWISEVQKCVFEEIYYQGLNPHTAKVALIGHSKDNTSYYLKMFPQWDQIEVENYKGINATDYRNQYLNGGAGLVNSFPVTESCKKFLVDFAKTKDYIDLCTEYEFIKNYKKSWEAAPYAPTFVTVDAICVQSGHVLVVRRGAAPGRGLWAMPGGFINVDERIKDAAIRELREETGIKIPDAVLRGSIVAQDVFDDPNRSLRGRTITHAFLIHLKGNVNLPKVKGSDDADKAKWLPISKLQRKDFYEDHYDIIQNMIARI